MILVLVYIIYWKKRKKKGKTKPKPLKQFEQEFIMEFHILIPSSSILHSSLFRLILSKERAPKYAGALSFLSKNRRKNPHLKGR